jgi:cell division protein FtsB
VHEYSRRPFAEEAVADSYPVDLNLSGLHASSVEADVRSRTRYRLGMAERADANNAHAISRLADSGEQAIRNLVALPLRMLAGTSAIFEALFRTAADTVREVDPLDERVMDLERRVDSLEDQTTRRDSSRSTSATRKTAATAAAAQPERSGP